MASSCPQLRQRPTKQQILYLTMSHFFPSLGEVTKENQSILDLYKREGLVVMALFARPFSAILDDSFLAPLLSMCHVSWPRSDSVYLNFTSAYLLTLSQFDPCLRQSISIWPLSDSVWLRVYELHVVAPYSQTRWPRIFVLSAYAAFVTRWAELDHPTKVKAIDLAKVFLKEMPWRAERRRAMWFSSLFLKKEQVATIIIVISHEEEQE